MEVIGACQQCRRDGHLCDATHRGLEEEALCVFCLDGEPCPKVKSAARNTTRPEGYIFEPGGRTIKEKVMQRTYNQGRVCAAPGCVKSIYDQSDLKYCTAKHDYWNQRLRAGKPLPDGSAPTGKAQPARPPKQVASKAKRLPVAALAQTQTGGSGLVHLTVPEAALNRYFAGLPLKDKARIIQQAMTGERMSDPA